MTVTVTVAGDAGGVSIWVAALRPSKWSTHVGSALTTVAAAPVAARIETRMTTTGSGRLAREARVPMQQRAIDLSRLLNVQY